MGDQIYDAGYYRKLAQEARKSAAKAVRVEHREGYFRLAEDWDRLAEDAVARDELMRLLRLARKVH
jgi:hypothetical protein